MWRNEQFCVRVAVATATRHSWKSHGVVGTRTDFAAISAAPAFVVLYIIPDPSVHAISSQASVDGYVAPAPVFSDFLEPPVLVVEVEKIPRVQFGTL